MIITNAKYEKDLDDVNTNLNATIDGERVSVPLSEDNRHYKEILKQVADGDITIAEAD
jgi:hypothetical protein